MSLPKPRVSPGTAGFRGTPPGTHPSVWRPLRKVSATTDPDESFEDFLRRALRRLPIIFGVVLAFAVIRLTGIRPGPLIIYVAAAVSLPLTPIYPEIGLYALILNFVNEFDSYYKLQQLLPISLPILFDAAVAFGIFRKMSSRDFRPRVEGAQNVLLLGYVLLVIASVIASDVFHPNIVAKFRSGFLIRPIIYLFLIMVVQTRRDLHRLLVAILAAEALLMAGSLSDYLQKGMTAYRVRGTVGAINYLSYVCVVIIPVLISLVAYVRHRTTRAMLFGLTLLTVFISMQTLSRSGYYALLATFLFLGLRFVRRPQLLVVGAVFAVLVFQLVPATLTERLAEVQDITQTSRWWLSRIGVRMALDNPVLGVGWHAYQDKFLEYDHENLFTSPKAPHSLYFNIAATTGFPALALYLSAFGLSLWQLTRIERTYRRERETRAFGYLLCLGVQGGLVGHFTFGLAGSYGDSYYAYMLLGLAVVLIRLHPRDRPFQPLR